MSQSERAADRRRFPRFTPRTDLFVLHSHFGKIMNIGMGGMLFTYLEKDGYKSNAPYQVVLFAKEDDYLVELPFRTISDTIHQQNHHGNIRKKVVVFENMNHSQFEQLEHFILDNIIVSPWENFLAAGS